MLGFYVVARMLDLYTREPRPPAPVRVWAVATAIVAILAMAYTLRAGIGVAELLAP